MTPSPLDEIKRAFTKGLDNFKDLIKDEIMKDVEDSFQKKVAKEDDGDDVAPKPRKQSNTQDLPVSAGNPVKLEEKGKTGSKDLSSASRIVSLANPLATPRRLRGSVSRAMVPATAAATREKRRRDDPVEQAKYDLPKCHFCGDGYLDNLQLPEMGLSRGDYTFKCKNDHCINWLHHRHRCSGGDSVLDTIKPADEASVECVECQDKDVEDDNKGDDDKNEDEDDDQDENEGQEEEGGDKNEDEGKGAHTKGKGKKENKVGVSHNRGRKQSPSEPVRGKDQKGPNQRKIKGTRKPSKAQDADSVLSSSLTDLSDLSELESDLEPQPKLEPETEPESESVMHNEIVVASPAKKRKTGKAATRASEDDSEDDNEFEDKAAARAWVEKKRAAAEKRHKKTEERARKMAVMRAIELREEAKAKSSE